MKNSPTLSELEHICTLMFNSFNVPIAFVNEENECVFSSFSRPFKNPLSSSKNDVLDQLRDHDNTSLIPTFVTTKLLETFVYVPIYINEKFQGNIIVGP